jgi:hypothetical protein
MKELTGIAIVMLKSTIVDGDHGNALVLAPKSALAYDNLFTVLAFRHQDLFEHDGVCQYAAHVADALREVHKYFKKENVEFEFEVRGGPFAIFAAALASLFAREVQLGIVELTAEDAAELALHAEDLDGLAGRPCPWIARQLSEFTQCNIIRFPLSDETRH